MKPAPVALRQEGQYKCEYSAFVTGEYEIRIKVGRGGGEFMDLIEGADPEPNNEVHEYSFKTTSRLAEDATTPQIFKLVVSPGETSARASLAVGDAITSSTSGRIGTFLITARDSFGNRRPGGDTITSLMRYWSMVNNSEADAAQLPKTGSIIDNKDGSYAVSYRITRAGFYQHAISFAAVLGAGSPVFLRVDSDEADISRSYVYGSVLTLSTGNPSTVYVQTRDQFGNHLRYTKEEKPCTGYPLTLETCHQKIEYELCFSREVPCPEVETNVGKTLEYQMGPTASETDASGEPYYGLYQITVYPLGEAGGKSYTPIVKHNDIYVSCYFDSGDLAGTPEADPGWQLANACADLKKDETSRRVYRRGGAGGEWSSVAAGVIRAEERGALADLYEQGQSEFGTASGDDRRAVTEISWDTTQLTVKQQFKVPDTSVLERWLHLAPVLCAMFGVVFSLLHALWDAYEVRRDAKVHALIADMDADIVTEVETAGAVAWALEKDPTTLDWALDGEERAQDAEPKAAMACCEEMGPDEGGVGAVEQGWRVDDIESQPRQEPQTPRELPTSRLSTPKRPASELRHALQSSRPPSASSNSSSPTIQARPEEEAGEQQDPPAEAELVMSRESSRRAEIPQALSPVPPPMPAED